MEKDEKRVAEILKVKSEKLPNVSGRTLRVYHSYLKENLSFPFEARYSEETGPLEDTYYKIKVTNLLELEECPDPEFYLSNYQRYLRPLQLMGLSKGLMLCMASSFALAFS